MTSPNINNTALKLSREHRIIFDYVLKIATLAGDHASETNATEIKSLLGFLKSDLHRHFAVEEQVFFPAAIETVPGRDMIRTVLQLQKQHGALEAEMAALLILFSPIHRMDRDSRQALREFLDKIRTHARQEIEQLFPKLGDDLAGRLKAQDEAAKPS